MTPEQKEKWVKALRSGRYKQAKLCLYDGAGYCCLGVANKVLKVDSYNDYFLTDKTHYVILDKIIQRELAELNDIGVPFEMIAGFIQENVECG